MPLAWLILLTVALLVVGYGGCALSERLRIPRLVGGISLWLILAHVLTPGYRPADLFTSADPPRRALAEHERQRIEDREVLGKTGVTPVALQEFDTATQQRTVELQGEIDRATTADRLYFNLALGYPAVMVTFAVGLLMAPRRERFARDLPFMLAAAMSAGVLAAIVGWTGTAAGWFEIAEISPALWITGLAIGCAIPTIPDRRASGPTAQEPLWRYGFEPMLYALVGSQVDLIDGLHFPLIVAVLILFGPGKVLGAAVLRRYVSQRSWGESVRMGVAVAAAGPLALAASYALYAVGMIDVMLFSALVLSAVAAALLSHAVLALTGSRSA